MDFEALAARLTDIAGVRACLLMSRDGLTLGVYPRDGEEVARSVGDRLLSVGDPERGFLLVGDELWIVGRRGPYVGIVVAASSATPGLLLDRLEFSLRAAEDLRLREGSAMGASRPEASRRRRVPLHPESEKVERRPRVDLSPADPSHAEPDAVSAAMHIVNMRDGVLAPSRDEATDVTLRPLDPGQPDAAERADRGGDEGTDAESDPELVSEPRVDLQPDPGPQVVTTSQVDLEGEEPAEEDRVPAPVPHFGDDREVDPVALAREFKNLFDRPDA